MSDYVRMRKSTMDSIAQAIQEKDGNTDKISGADMPDRIRAIQSGVNYLQFMYSCGFLTLNMFGASKVELTFPNLLELTNMFGSKAKTWDEWLRNTTVQELIIHCPNKVTGAQTFIGQGNFTVDTTLKKITLDVDFSNCNSFGSMFEKNEALEVIDGQPINMTESNQDRYATNMFRGCSSLREVRFSGTIAISMDFKSCPLSKDTIFNIFSCLSDTASGKTLTLKASAVNTAFETSEGASDGSSSTEWTAIVDSHSNWTISLI